MKKLSCLSTLILLQLFVHLCVNAQINLVPNSSFENIISCDSLGAGSVCVNQVPPWNCQGGSPDLYNSCSVHPQLGCPFNVVGYQVPHSFNGYIGLFTYTSIGLNYRETITVRLDSTLKFNRKYCISFYVNLADSSAYAVNNLGMYISDSIINSNTSLFTLSPQIFSNVIISDTVNWILISGEYIAHGGEQYIFIGNFFPDSLTNIVIFNHNTLIPSPVAYYYIDDVSIVDCTNIGIQEIENPNHISISPIPNNGSMQLNYTLGNNENGIITFYNVLGEKIRTYKLQKNDNMLDINETELQSGIYFYKVIVNDRLVKSDKVIINK